MGKKRRDNENTKKEVETHKLLGRVVQLSTIYWQAAIISHHDPSHERKSDQRSGDAKSIVKRQMSGTITHKILYFIGSLRSYRLIVLSDHHPAEWAGGDSETENERSNHIPFAKGLLSEFGEYPSPNCICDCSWKNCGIVTG